MRNNPLGAWIRAVAPAVIWLLTRQAGRGLPPGAEIGLEATLAAAAGFLLVRENGRSAFRRPGREALPYLGIGILMAAAGRICLGRPADPERTRIAFLQICVIGPAAEEILYRGLAGEGLRRLLPEAGAAIVSSLLFAAAHGTPARMLCAFAAGLLFYRAFRKTGSLWVPLLMHMILNGAAFF